MSDIVLELKGITKTFPGVKALNHVHFELRRGEIHALMGENGAGKSTFIKVITGVHRPDDGEILLYGNKVDLNNPRDAQKAGIAAIYQHVTCYPELTVTENIFLGHEQTHLLSRKIKWSDMHQKAQALLDDLSGGISARQLMGSLSVAEQQIVEIAKALSTNANIIIMDEPTAALTNRECEELYRITEALREQGKSIIFISHRFEDAYRLADRVTVFRDSEYIGTYGMKDITYHDLVVAMVGREVTQLYPEKVIPKEDTIFEVKNLSLNGYFQDVSFSVRRGEIFGLTGLVGAGRTEVCQTIFGINTADAGSILVEGATVKIRSVEDAMTAGIGYLPEDRQKQGLILDWSILSNISLSELKNFAKGGVINRKSEQEKSALLADKLNVKSKNYDNPVSSLSGGNQQKVIFAKLLNSDLKVLLLDEPTKGVDVGAKSAIYEIMRQLTGSGYAIVMVSSEMPEILGMCNRILVMKEGRVTAQFDDKDATSEKLLQAAMSPELMQLSS